MNYPDWRKLQRFALATFYYATSGGDADTEAGSGWYQDANWLSYNHNECDDWYFSGPVVFPGNTYGLTELYPVPENPCSSTTGEIEHLWLGSNSLKGTLPNELFTMLTGLKSISAYINFGLKGTIPTLIGRLTDLEYIALFISGIDGSIPTEIGLVTRLSHLLLIDDELTGTLPSEIFLLSNLKTLVLDENNLTGTLPTEIALLSNSLNFFTASYNFIGGQIPSELGQLASATDLGTYVFSYSDPTELTYVFNNNQLSGTIPTELGLMRAAEYLEFLGNPIFGTIPSELGKNAALRSLAFADSFVSGPIPSELGSLSNLRVLYLDGNDLTGSVPEELEALAKGSLMHFDISRNPHISGSIPSEFCGLPGDACRFFSQGSSDGCGMLFDCSDELCGCNKCPCL